MLEDVLFFYSSQIDIGRFNDILILSSIVFLIKYFASKIPPDVWMDRLPVLPEYRVFDLTTTPSSIASDSKDFTSSLGFTEEVVGEKRAL